MPTQKKLVIDGITLDPAGPTTVPVGRLFAWVIWQFPKMRDEGHSGAVHPPQAGHGWYPAIVNVKAGHVLIYGHVKEQFSSPDAAAKHLDRATS